MPSINNVIGLPSEVFNLPPENREHMRAIAERFWQITWLRDLCEKALEDWNESIAVRSLPEYIARVHDDGHEGRYTIAGHGRIEIDWDDSVRMVPEQLAEEETCQSNTDSL